jgi:single-strand DNA-binding protein
MMNAIVLEMRLTKDPEVRTVKGKNGDTFVCNMRCAFDGGYFTNKDDSACFIDVISWGKLAETCGNNLRAKRRIVAQGLFRIRQYTDNNGNKRIVPELIADKVSFLDAPVNAENAAGSTNEATGTEGNSEINLDDLPF